MSFYAEESDLTAGSDAGEALGKEQFLVGHSAGVGAFTLEPASGATATAEYAFLGEASPEFVAGDEKPDRVPAARVIAVDGSGDLLVVEEEAPGILNKGLSSGDSWTDFEAIAGGGQSRLGTRAQPAEEVDLGTIDAVSVSPYGSVVLLVDDSHTLALLDGRRKIRELKTFDGTVYDIAHDELGNVYVSSTEGLTRIDRSGALSKIALADDDGRPIEPRQIAFSKDGSLYGTFASSRPAIFALERPSGLTSSLASAFDVRTLVSGVPVAIDVPEYCSCHLAMAQPFFNKLKMRVRVSEGDVSPVDDSDRFSLLVYYEGADSLQVQVPKRDSASRYLEEAWSGRKILVTQSFRTLTLLPERYVELAGRKYSLFAIPAQSQDLAFDVSSEVVGFATSWSEIPIPPGARFFDARNSFGSVVFGSGLGAAAEEPIVAGVGLRRGGTWRGVTPVEEWGNSMGPTDF